MVGWISLTDSALHVARDGKEQWQRVMHAPRSRDYVVLAYTGFRVPIEMRVPRNVAN